MNVGFIGAGNMGGALARIINTYKHINVYIYDINEEKSKKLAHEIDAFYCDLDYLLKESDFIFLGVKPNIIDSLCQQIAGKLKDYACIISMAAGVKLERLEASLGKETPIIRIMPNTPVTFGEGMTAWCKNAAADDDTTYVFKTMMKFTGAITEIPEDEFEAFTAIAGCGPAYAYMFIDALAKAGEICGLPYDRALFYASKMLRGSALMAENSPLSPEVLCKNVCSPGGSTIEGVKVLEAKEFEDSVIQAIIAAYNKTRELGKK